MAAACLAGAIGDHVAYEGIFYLLAAMCTATVISTLMIRTEEIDHELARGSDSLANDATDSPMHSSPSNPEQLKAKRPHVAGIGELLSDRRVVIIPGDLHLTQAGLGNHLASSRNRLRGSAARLTLPWLIASASSSFNTTTRTRSGKTSTGRA